MQRLTLYAFSALFLPFAHCMQADARLRLQLVSPYDGATLHGPACVPASVRVLPAAALATRNISTAMVLFTIKFNTTNARTQQSQERLRMEERDSSPPLPGISVWLFPSFGAEAAVLQHSEQQVFVMLSTLREVLRLPKGPKGSCW